MCLVAFFQQYVEKAGGMMAFRKWTPIDARQNKWPPPSPWGCLYTLMGQMSEKLLHKWLIITYFYQS
jgi:hypothetical protein